MKMRRAVDCPMMRILDQDLFQISTADPPLPCCDLSSPVPHEGSMMALINSKRHCFLRSCWGSTSEIVQRVVEGVTPRRGNAARSFIFDPAAFVRKISPRTVGEVTRN
jgi:hypothetical protein